MCKDYEWRFELEPGSVIDACDKQNVWYNSTILEIKKSQEEDDDEVVMAKIAYRVYTDLGNKTDEHGNSYQGWSSKYDEWISVTSPRISKQNNKVVMFD